MGLLGDLSNLARKGEVSITTVENKDGTIAWSARYEKGDDRLIFVGDDLRRLIGSLRYFVEIAAGME